MRCAAVLLPRSREPPVSSNVSFVTVMGTTQTSSSSRAAAGAEAPYGGGTPAGDAAEGAKRRNSKSKASPEPPPTATRLVLLPDAGDTNSGCTHNKSRRPSEFPKNERFLTVINPSYSTLTDTSMGLLRFLLADDAEGGSAARSGDADHAHGRKGSDGPAGAAYVPTHKGILPRCAKRRWGEMFAVGAAEAFGSVDGPPRRAVAAAPSLSSAAARAAAV